MSLRDAIETAQQATTRLATLKTRHAEVDARERTLRDDVDMAKASLMRALGAAAVDEGTAADVTAARAAVANAETAHETAELELQGIGERIAAAESRSEELARAVSRGAAAVAIERNAKLETRLRVLSLEFANLLEQHRALARFANAYATDANGRRTEPIDTCGPNGYPTKFQREITDMLTAPRPQSATPLNYAIADFVD